MRRATRYLPFPAGLAVLLALAWLALWAPNAQAETPTPPPAGNGGAAQEGGAELGARLYSENCVVCHGPDGQGRVGATLAKDWPSIRPDLTVRTIIANGVQGSPMPAWSKAKGGPFGDAEIDALVQYILSWQTGGAPQFTPRPTVTLSAPLTPPANVQGDPNHGAQLYHENCVMCHGPNGEGRAGATLAKAWPGIRPDLSVKTTIANGVEGSPMPAWSQAQGGPLSEAEINDLTAFVLALGQTNPVVQVSAEPASPRQAATLLSGWLGVALFVVLFVVIIVAALLLQRQRA